MTVLNVDPIWDKTQFSALKYLEAAKTYSSEPKIYLAEPIAVIIC